MNVYCPLQGTPKKSAEIVPWYREAMTTHSSVGENSNTGWHEMFILSTTRCTKKNEEIVPWYREAMTTHSSVGENSNTGWHEMFTVRYKVHQKKSAELVPWHREAVTTQSGVVVRSGGKGVGGLKISLRTVTLGDMKCLLSATRCTKK